MNNFKQALIAGDLDRIKSMIDDDRRLLSRKDDCGYASLHWSAAYNRIELAELLLDLGVPIDINSLTGITSLSIALSAGHEEMVDFLLQKGANPKSGDKLNWTPLHSSALRGVGMSLLLSRRVDVNIRHKMGWTPLHLASHRGLKEPVKLLIEQNANVNLRDRAGWTALHFASNKGHSEVVQLLLKNNANAFTRNKSQKTPADLALEKGFKDLELLIRQVAA